MEKYLYTLEKLRNTDKKNIYKNSIRTFKISNTWFLVCLPHHTGYRELSTLPMVHLSATAYSSNTVAGYGLYHGYPLNLQGVPLFATWGRARWHVHAHGKLD